MLFPVYLKLNAVRCLVVGGGAVAERKVLALLETGCFITVVAPAISPVLTELNEQGLITVYQQEFTDDCLTELQTGRSLVFAATNDEDVNHQIFEQADRRGLMVNVVDDPEYCSFFVPAVVRRGDLSIAVSTSGRSPLLARRLREKLEVDFGPEYAIWVEILGECRARVLKSALNETDRKEVFKELIDSDLLSLLKEGKIDQVRERVDECLWSWSV